MKTCIFAFRYWTTKQKTPYRFLPCFNAWKETKFPNKKPFKINPFSPQKNLSLYLNLMWKIKGYRKLDFYTKPSPKRIKTTIFHKNHNRVVPTLAQGCAEVAPTLARRRFTNAPYMLPLRSVCISMELNGNSIVIPNLLFIIFEDYTYPFRMYVNPWCSLIAAYTVSQARAALAASTNHPIQQINHQNI